MAPEHFDRELARLIDHTLLKPEASAPQIEQLCMEAKEYSFCSVCINPFWVPTAIKWLTGPGVKVCTVIGFPLGAISAAAKAEEAREAAASGAVELDMVLNIGALKSGDERTVRADIASVVAAAGSQAIVKVILETGLLTEVEKIRACIMAKEAGAAFVKTSTGFGPGGATVEDIELMRQTVGPNMGVKASGGIRDYATARKMIDAGASRIGASAGIAIVTAAPGGGNTGY
jgi:deoxyribose-phosphate aldolase